MTQTDYTSGEAARLCGLGLTTLKRWIRKGALRAYRTPGGDLRICHEHLCAFMRAYDIPIHGSLVSEQESVLLIALEADAVRGLLIEQARVADSRLRVVVVENDFDLGCEAALLRPAYVILADRGGEDARCRLIRQRLAPQPVRIGIIKRDDGGSVPHAGFSQPEVIGDPTTGPRWSNEFLTRLLNAPAPASVRQAG